DPACLGRRTGRRPSDSYPKRGDPTMAKKQSPKPQSKAAKQKKDRKHADLPKVQVPAATESLGQPEAPVANEGSPDTAAPTAPEQPTAEPPLPECMPAEATTPVEVASESAATEAGSAAKAEAEAEAEKAAKEPKPKKTSALDAAAKVLAESGEAMTTQAMIEAMAAKDYWSSPGGATAAATLYSAILRELSTKGEQARFVKTQRGKFGLRSPE